MGSTKSVLLVMHLLEVFLTSGLGSSDQEVRCEEIRIPMCMEIGYNLTLMPNELNYETQEEAGLEVQQFWALAEIKCSLDLKLFLCSIYVPICIPSYKKYLPPCQGLRQRVREGCEPIMTQFGFKWPKRMDCDQFPVFGASLDQLCVDNTNASNTLSSKRSPRLNKLLAPCRESKNCLKCKSQWNSPQYNRSAAGFKNCLFYHVKFFILFLFGVSLCHHLVFSL